MSVKIEELGIAGTTATAAFYYTIAVEDQLLNAVDATREPAGITLSVAERQALKDGALYEFQHSLPTSGMNENARQNAFEAAYRTKDTEAQAEYQTKYSEGIGSWWNGTVWAKI